MNLNVAYSWPTITIAIALLAIYGAVTVRIARSGLATRDFRVLVYITLAILMLLFAPILLVSLWLALNTGLPVAWKRLTDVLGEDCLCLLLFGFELTVLPGTLIGISAALDHLSVRKRTLIATATGLVASQISGIVMLHRYGLVFEIPPLVRVVLTLFDIAGTLGTAFATIKITDWFFKSIDDTSTEAARRTRLLKPLKVVAIVCFMTMLVSSTIYLFFIHQLPGRIDIIVDDWHRFTFSHALRRITDPVFQDPLLATLRANAAHIDSGGNEFVVRLTAKRRDFSNLPTVHLTVFTLASMPTWERLARDLALPVSAPLFSKNIPVGDIVLRGPDLNPLIGSLPPAPIPMTLFLPRGRAITFSKESGALGYFSSEPPAQGPIPRGGALSVSSSGMTFQTSLGATFFIIANIPVSVSTNNPSIWEVVIPGETSPLTVKGDEERCCRGPAIALLVRGQKETQVTFPSETGHVVFQNASFQFPAERFAWEVNDLRMTRPVGKMTFGTSARLLDGTGDLYINGDSLRLRRASDNSLRAEGATHLLTLNGVVLSTSAWMAIPVEIRAVLVAAVLGVAGWLVRHARRANYFRHS